jgi:hypothetical protein
MMMQGIYSMTLKTKKILSIIVFIIIQVVIVSISTNLYNTDFAEKADIRQFYQTANRVTDKSDFDYLLNTGAGRSIVQTELQAVDSVTLPQVTSGKKFTYISAKYQEYLSHVETYTVTVLDGKGKSHTVIRTRIVWEWENVGSDIKQANELTFFGHKYNQSLFDLGKYASDLPLKSIIKGSKDSSNIQDTGHYKRTIWYGIPDKFDTTFYADLSTNGLQPIQFPNQSRDKQIRLHANQPIAKFLENELQANTPHPILWTVITLVIVTAVGLVWLLIFNSLKEW